MTSLNAGGMQPVSELPESLTSVRFESLPSSQGISPVREFELRLRWVRPDRSPSCPGMVPERLLDGRRSLVTRLGVPPVVTPSQPVIAVSTLQLSAAVAPELASLAASSAMQSCMRPGLSAWSDTARPQGGGGVGGTSALIVRAHGNEELAKLVGVGDQQGQHFVI